MRRAAAFTLSSLTLIVVACSSFDDDAPPAQTNTNDASVEETSTQNDQDAAPSGDPPIAITAGQSVACALRASKRVACWGNNETGAVGAPTQGDEECAPHTTKCRTTAVQVGNLENVKQVSAGTRFVCALREDGVVLCWGDNGRARLGAGATPASRFDAAQVVGLPPAIEIATGEDAACARVNENATTRVYCWGSNLLGLTGKVDDKTSPPTPLPSLDGAKAIRMNAVLPGSACAILADDSVRCWGSNRFAVLGHLPGNGLPDGDPRCDGFAFTPCTGEPGPVGDVTTFKADDVIVGESWGCALRAGKVSCWGWNGQGGVGITPHDYPERPTPIEIPTLQEVKKISGRRGHACAIAGAAAQSELRCWGSNGSGELANGFTGPFCIGQRCNPEPTRAADTLSNITDVAAGSGFTLAIANGVLYAWGSNNEGTLGHARNTNEDQSGVCFGTEPAVCNGSPRVVVLP